MSMTAKFDAANVAAGLRSRHAKPALGGAIEKQVQAGQLTPTQASEVARVLEVSVDEARLATLYANRTKTGAASYGALQSPPRGADRKNNLLNFRAQQMTGPAPIDAAGAVKAASSIIDVASVTELTGLVAGLKGSVLVVTDLDYTVLVTQDAVGRDAWYEDLIKRKCGEGMSVHQAEAFADDLWVKAQQTSAIMPVEGETTNVFKGLQKDAAMVMALTSRDLRLVDTTPRQLDTLDVSLKGGALHPKHSGSLSDVSDFREGILTIKPGENKGTHLVAFLEKFGLSFDHVVMLDDKKKNLVDVKAALDAHGVSFTGCNYEVGKKHDDGLNLSGTLEIERLLTADPQAAVENTFKRSLLNEPRTVSREPLAPRPELDGLPHTLNMSPSDFAVGQSYPVLGAEWYNKWNEPLYGPALHGSISQIIFAPRMGQKEMMRVAHEVPAPDASGKSFAVITNAQGHASFVAFDGADHKKASAFTPVKKDAVPEELKRWHDTHLAGATGAAGATTKPIPLEGTAFEKLLDDMGAAQIALSGTAKRSPELLKKVTDNLKEMNRHLLSAVKDGRALKIEDLEFLNAMATRGKSHYGDDIETVRGVARGFSRNIRDDASGELRRIQNNEHIESTVALNFSPPHIAGRETQALLNEINAVKKGTSLEEIARIYQRMILIHPFSDGTGRTSFCVLDAMLIKSGRRPLPHTEESGIPLFKTVPELAKEFSRAYAQA
jgi:Protein of unknown function (DUF2608)/Fic/DOC family